MTPHFVIRFSSGIVSVEIYYKLIIKMLNLQLGSIREIDNAYIYFHLLDSCLEGISEQRSRIKEIATRYRESRSRVFDDGSTIDDQTQFLKLQKKLFREIKVFFWWWSPVYTILWVGECIDKKNEKYTDCLVTLLDKDFSEQLKRHRNLVEIFHNVRNGLEHILERIYNGEHVLGNLSDGSGRRDFQICGKSIDISDNALNFVDVLSSTLNQWLLANSDQGA